MKAKKCPGECIDIYKTLIIVFKHLDIDHSSLQTGDSFELSKMWITSSVFRLFPIYK